MKWYKRDPDAALTGMRGLSHDAKSAYGTIIDLSYSRDGDLDDDEHFMCIHIECRPQWWRRVRAELIAAGKIRIVAGKIIANRVETELKLARNFAETQSKLATKGWVSRKNPSKTNDPPKPSLSVRAREQPEEDISSFFPTAATPSVDNVDNSGTEAAAVKQAVADKKPEEMTLAEINVARWGKRA